MQMRASQTLKIRSSKKSLALLEGILAIPFFISIFATKNQPSMWIPVVILVIFAVVVFVWMISFRIEVAFGMLKYHSLLGGTKEVRLNEIEVARIEVGYSKYMDRFRPPVRLCVRPQRGLGAKAFDINLRVFDRSDIDQLLSVIQEGKED
jgi:hypothetical protein